MSRFQNMFDVKIEQCDKEDEVIPEEAISLHETVSEVLERRLGDWIHEEMPTYGETRTDKLRGILYVGLLVAITAVAGFFLGRESLRYYPDPGVGQTTVQPQIHILIPPASPPDAVPDLWPASS